MAKMELTELTLENIGSWPFWVRTSAISAIAVAVIFLGLWFDTRSQMVTLEKHQKIQVTLRKTFEEKSHQAANYKLYQLQLSQMKHIFNDLLRQLPGHTEVPALLEDISAIGHANGLRFSLFKPMPEKLKEFYAELPIKINVQGTYHQIAQFISEVSSLDRIVTIGEFSIETPKAKKSRNVKTINIKDSIALNMSLTAKTYRYEEEKSTHETQSSH